MSYDIYVKNRKTGKTVELNHAHLIAGGTYAEGGTTRAWLNVTYNYSDWFEKVWPEKDCNEGGIRSLYGIPLDEAISRLEAACDKLKGNPDKDYWKPTQGNAREALFNLLMLCKIARHENPRSALTIEGD